GTASAGYTQYSATFTPTANAQGTATIAVASAKFSDAAGNTNPDTYVNPAPAGSTYESNNIVALAYNTLVADTAPPKIAVSRLGTGVATGAETLTFTLSEASSNFVLADIDATGGVLSNFAPVASSGTASAGYTQYTATFTPTAGVLGTATVGVLSGKFTDAASNANQDTYLAGVAGAVQEVNNQVSFAFNTDVTAPGIVVGRTGAGTISTTEVITFTLSEASTDFTLADIDVTGGTLTNLQGSGTSYTATFTPTAGTSGVGTIGVDTAKFTDAAGNLNKDTYKVGLNVVGGTTYEANNQVSVPFNTDNAPPNIVVGRIGTGDLLGTSVTETITFTLSEASTDFVLADIDVTGGTLTNLVPVASSGTPSTGYTQYTATFTPTAGTSGTATIDVDGNKFSDAAGNLNKDTYTNPAPAGQTYEANNQVSFGFNTT
ncbi:Ig-like domain-containing protein, partial [Limnohabitans sp. 2KL-51]|uniref:Ig-like domain-containing protein n=1 Tax=Limnohabitans sp. 2KL-51 TaxID=1977911 RepID=UPI0018EE89CB